MIYTYIYIYIYNCLVLFCFVLPSGTKIPPTTASLLAASLQRQEAHLGQGRQHDDIQRPQLASRRRPPRQRASSSQRPRQSSHPKRCSNERLDKLAILREDQEVPREQDNDRAKREGVNGVLGVLGESKGTAAECEVQEPPAGIPATACNSNPAMVATSVGLETSGSSSIHFGGHGAPNRRDKLEKGT